MQWLIVGDTAEWRLLLFQLTTLYDVCRDLQNMDYGHERETLVRFLNAREGNISNAHKMVCFSVDSIPFGVE